MPTTSQGVTPLALVRWCAAFVAVGVLGIVGCSATSTNVNPTTVNPVFVSRAIQKGRAVDGEAQHPVVILYEHALLGEGLAKYLHAETGVEATVARGHDLQAVASALALGPAVVIFELSDALRLVDLSALAPKAVLIDVSTVVARGPGACPAAVVLEKILAAVRVGSRHEPSPRVQP